MDFLNKFSPTIIILGLMSITELIFVGTTDSFLLWMFYGVYKLLTHIINGNS